MHYPHTQARWLRWRAPRCTSCGLRWPCSDAKVMKVRATAQVRQDRTGAWAGPTDTAWSTVGQAGLLTPAQELRAGIWRGADRAGRGPAEREPGQVAPHGSGLTGAGDLDADASLARRQARGSF